MASTGLQLVGFILGVLSWVGMIATCASPEWRKNSHGQTLIDNTIRYDGLWVRCKAFATGQTHCDDYNTFFIGLPGVLQVCRALMIASIGIGFIAILITIVGIKCTSIGSKNQRAKARVAMVGGLLFGVAGIHTGIAVSAFASCVSTKCFDHLQVTDLNMDYQLGPAVYGGWVVSMMALVGSLLLIIYDEFWRATLNTTELKQRRSDCRCNGSQTEVELNGIDGIYKLNGSAVGPIEISPNSSYDTDLSNSTPSYRSTPGTKTSRSTARSRLLHISPSGDKSNTSYNTSTTSNTPSTSEEMPAKKEWRDTLSTTSVLTLITTHL